MNSSAVLLVSGTLFILGVAIVLTRRHAVVMLMGIEIMLAAANLQFVAYQPMKSGASGGLVALFVLVVAAAEVALALAVLLGVYRALRTSDPSKMNQLKG
jgi:NADH-quinone oxidoreductase subunit K